MEWPDRWWCCTQHIITCTCKWTNLADLLPSWYTTADHHWSRHSNPAPPGHWGLSSTGRRRPADSEGRLAPGCNDMNTKVTLAPGARSKQNFQFTIYVKILAGKSWLTKALCTKPYVPWRGTYLSSILARLPPRFSQWLKWSCHDRRLVIKVKHFHL